MEEELVSPVGIAAWRLTWYPRLLLGALGLALLIVVAAGDGSSTASGRVGGDYPAFYAAGAIVLDGDIDRLYDPVVQSDRQADLLGNDTGYLAFVYPPHVAVTYMPLAALPYRLSYIVHTALMTGAVLLALILVRPMVSFVDRWYWVSAAGCLSVFPLFRAVGAGQNTALTILLVAALWRALAEDREVFAGVAAGLLLFRPQYAIPIIGLLLIARHGRAVAVATGVGALTWLANALIVGPKWFMDWFDEVGPFIEEDAEVNARNAISWLGFSDALVDTDIGVVIGGSLAAASAGVLIMMWRRPHRFALDVRIAATAAGVVLMSPHAMFYDSGVLVITALVAIDRGWIAGRASVAIWVLSLSHLASGVLGATPLALVVMAGFVGVLAMAFDPTPERIGEPVEVPA